MRPSRHEGARRTRYSGTASLLVLACTLVACAASNPATQPDGNGANTTTATRVATPGVQPCREFVREVAPTKAPDGTPRATGLPARRLQCLSRGPDVDLALLNGHPVVINLWASWCEPCRAEMPVLQEVAERARGSVSFLGVVTKDRPLEAARFLSEVDVTYAQVIDPDGQLLGDLRSPGLPVTVILKPDGTIHHTKVGGIDEAGDLEALIASAATASEVTSH
ncbi:TlpA disulfide reductase family protein [Nocardioides sp. SOB77]|uniref:TlpA disulfide reductase family protein n=1 Tax=Nocardioides oceani TaxID=3058369 RepID=A0ABT8FM90_9ACTN|nr:TlpA disulfide reductase family protein [Nocardioides oceani]MDN4175788.1 TlpA disulfide reductase family protein [Nocardioides oceani]